MQHKRESPRIEESSQSAASSPLDRNRVAAGTISVVARKLRFTNSRHSKLYLSVGLRPRPVDRLFKALSVCLIFACLVLPNAAAIGYFGFLAADQYRSETRFTVETSAPLSKEDIFGRVSGLPAAAIVQDTQIVTNYITSRAMLTALEKKGEFLKAYVRKDVNRLDRLDRNSSAEKRLAYWKDMVDTGIAAKSGIVTVSVRAFAAQDAKRLLVTVVDASEKLINNINDRVWSDATRSAKKQVTKATRALAQAREQLQNARNKSGILTVQGASNSLTALVTQLRGEKLRLQDTFNVNAKSVSRDAPQMRVLARKIESKKKQIENLNDRIAGGRASGDTLADASSQFSQLQFNQQIAERQLKASIAAFEQLQYSSRQQLMYLDTFLAPTLPDSAEYPKRFLWISIVFGVSLLVFGFARLALSTMRRRFD